MSVLLPNASLGVRRSIDSATYDAHGARVSGGWGPVIGPAEGRMKERADGGWDLGVDPGLWPVKQGDLIIGLDGRSWLVNTANLIQNSYDSYVDWVRIDAMQRSLGGTEPGGAWFVSRYGDSVTPVEPGDPDAPPVQAASNLWTGFGPPPDDYFGQKAGDEYMDLNTGVVYRFTGEP